MKKLLSLIAIVVALFALTTTAFAFSCTGSFTGAVLDGTTVTYDPANTEGFVFEYIADADITGGTTKIDVTNLRNAGWTIEAIDGKAEFSGSAQVTGINPAANTIQVKYSNGSYAANGKAVAQFKAIPGAGATIDGVTFTVTPMFNVGGLYKTPVTYTLAEAAAAQEEVVDATVIEENADAVVYGAENSYWGVWVGTYKVALNGKTLQSAVVTFEGVDGKSFPTQNTNWVEGEGEATFKIAIIGVPDEYADKSVAKATLK